MNLRDQTLGTLAADLPAATTVFLRHHLDFCCRGTRTLAQACEDAALDPGAIEEELVAEAARADDAARWEQRSPAEIAEHIEVHYHAALRRDVPALVAAARKVERVHASKPTVPAGLADELSDFWEEMQSHMIKEEEILFPMLRRGVRGPVVEPPIRVMEREHDEHGERLARIRALTGDHQAPPEACATWRALYDGLARLEAELMLHIHLENHVLFARALAR
jgi:regulator of cell morphogenesis and NO signaling